MKTIHELLSTQDFVPVLYTKADGTTKAYLLTQRKAPSYEAKTDRVKVDVPAHLVNAWDMSSEKFVSLKLDSLTGV